MQRISLKLLYVHGWSLRKVEIFFQQPLFKVDIAKFLIMIESSHHLCYYFRKSSSMSTTLYTSGIPTAAIAPSPTSPKALSERAITDGVKPLNFNISYLPRNGSVLKSNYGGTVKKIKCFRKCTWKYTAGIFIILSILLLALVACFLGEH